MSDRKSKPRCVMLFEESIKSKYTRKNYDMHLKQFRMFAGISSNKDLLVMTQNKLQVLVEDYLVYLRHTANPNSIPSQFQGIRHFCIMNRMRIDWDIIRRMFPQRQKSHALRSYTTREIREMLSNAKSVRDRALLYFLTSTGARIGVFDHPLLTGHLQKMSMGCNAVRLYAGEIDEYWAFLTPQASRALDIYHDLRRHKGEIFSENTPIFATRATAPRQLGWSGARSAIYRIVSKSDTFRSMQCNRYDVQTNHGFRKRFNTILKLDNSVNYNIAEKLMGHKNGLDGVYFVPTLEDLFAEFRKVMHRLEI